MDILYGAEKSMAEKKVVGRLVNTVSFQTDRASLQKALADIKKVKEAMKGLVVPANAMRKQAAAMKQQTQGLRQQTKAKSDYFIVQKAIDKREKSQLATQEKYSRAKQKQSQAEKSIASARIRQAAGNLTSGGSGQKASQSLFADMMRNEARMGKVHSRALAENAKRDRVASQNTANSASRRKDMFAADRFNLSNRFGNAGNRRFDEIASRYAGATSSLRMYRQEVSALRRDLTGAANAQRGFNGTMKDMRSAFVQMTASYTAFAGLMGIANVGKSFQGFQSALTMGFGGEAEAAPMIEYLRKEIRRLGLDIKDTTDDFSKLAVAAKGKLNNSDIQGLFSGYMEYANVAGAGKERTALGMRAMQQMLS